VLQIIIKSNSTKHKYMQLSFCYGHIFVIEKQFMYLWVFDVGVFFQFMHYLH